MIDSWASYSSRPASLAEQALYDRLLSWAESASPNEILDCFRKLFIDGTGHPDLEARRAIETILADNHCEREFKFVLNRSCYILINRWLMHPQLRAYVPDLIGLMEQAPTGFSHSRTTQRLRELVPAFLETEQYQALKHLAQVIRRDDADFNAQTPLGHMIHRYPCLYEHTLLTKDSSREHWQRVRALRRQAQKRYEIELSQYLTHRKRLEGVLVLTPASAEIVLPSSGVDVKNPTLLSDRKFNAAIELFTGRVDGTNTLKDLANQFVTYSRDTRCYRTFKAELYEYLTSGVDAKYGQHQFNQNLYRQLSDTLPNSDADKMNEMLLVSTCQRLLNFLVVESAQQPSHYVFSDLTANLGITPTMGLLLRIVLVCHKVRHHLERRFAILFNHYQGNAQESVKWLVDSLEHLNIAFSTNFGPVKLY